MAAGTAATPDGAADLHLLRLCSVHALPADPSVPLDPRFDPVGGMQSHTALLAAELDRRGISQTIVTARLSGPRTTHPLGARGTVHRVGLPVPRLRQLWAADALRRVLRGRYDLVHAHQGEDVAVLPLAWLAARWHRCPLVVTVHCSVAHTLVPARARDVLLRVVGGPVETAVLRRADAVIVLTDLTARRLGTRTAASTIPSGVDLSRPRRETADPLPHVPRPRIVYVGRLAPQKAVDTLLRAAVHVPAAVVLVGDGPDRPALAALAGRLGIADRVTFTGFVPHERTAAYLEHGDVLVLPSRYEELGSVLLEGLAVGIPVVASRVGGIPSVVADGRNGLLVDPLDPPGLAHAVGRVLGDPALAERLREEGRRTAARYDWRVLADDVVGVYREAARRASRRRSTSV